MALMSFTAGVWEVMLLMHGVNVEWFVWKTAAIQKGILLLVLFILIH